MLTKNGYTNPVKLGHGGYSVVYKYQSTRTAHRKEVAIKFIDMDKSDQNYRMLYMPRELEALKSLRHPNIVKIIQGLNDGSLHEDNFPHRYWIVMELCGTDLFDACAQFPRYSVPEKTARIWFQQIGEALKFMKEKGWAHRDLKPENILIRNNETALLTDFSFVRIQEKGTLSTTPLCTPVYAAPEVLRVVLGEVEAYDAFPADIWSLAHAMYFATAGEGLIPHKLEDKHDILISHKRIPVRINRAQISESLKDLLMNMTEMTPAKRTTIEQMLEHKWFTIPEPELKPLSPDPHRSTEVELPGSRVRPPTMDLPPPTRQRSKKSVAPSLLVPGVDTPRSPSPSPSPGKQAIATPASATPSPVKFVPGVDTPLSPSSSTSSPSKYVPGAVPTSPTPSTRTNTPPSPYEKSQRTSKFIFPPPAKHAQHGPVSSHFSPKAGPSTAPQAAKHKSPTASPSPEKSKTKSPIAAPPARPAKRKSHDEKEDQPKKKAKSV